MGEYAVPDQVWIVKDCDTFDTPKLISQVLPNQVRAGEGPFKVLDAKQANWKEPEDVPLDVAYKIAIPGFIDPRWIWVLRASEPGIWRTSPTKPDRPPVPVPAPGSVKVVISLSDAFQAALDKVVEWLIKR